MEKEVYLDKIYALSFAAGMNQRYHQAKSTRYSYTDKKIRIMVGIVALSGVVFSLLSATIMDQPFLVILSVTISIFSLIIAIILNVHPAERKAMFHSDLLQRWSSLREDADSVFVMAEATMADTISDDLITRLQELTAKKNRINAREDAPDKELLKACHEDENMSRTGRASTNDVLEKMEPA